MQPQAERVLLCALFAVAFFATAGLLRPHVQADHETEPADKLEFLDQHAADYNALLVGASGVFRGLDPGAFDPAVQAIEPTFESFNLGARGMLAYESDALLRAAIERIERGGGRVRWVVIEPKNWDPALSADDVLRTRTRTWHDAAQTRTAVLVSLNKLLTGRERYAPAWAGRHIQAFAQRLANYGSARRILRPLLDEQRRPYVTPEALEASDGYVSIEASNAEKAAIRRFKFMAALPAYEAELDEFAESPPEPLVAAELRAHRRQREWLEAKGIQPIYLVPPYGTHGRAGATLHAAGEAPLFADFARPQAYPELYAPEARLDQEHLNAEAAELFSRLAGEAVADLLAAATTYVPESSE